MPTRLLLIEDNPGDALIFREKLNESALDYELVHTQRLREGLDLIETENFDLILVDLSLPDAAGLEAVTQVIQAAPQRPVIVLTGLDDANIAAQARQEGAIDYLVKWYHDGPSLARYVRYAIAQMRMQSEGRIGTDSGRAAAEERAAAEMPDEEPAPADTPSPPIPDPPGRRPVDPIREALDSCQDGIAVVTGDGQVTYANDQARRWIGDTGRYPWRLKPGQREVPSAGAGVTHDVAPTAWEGQRAFMVTLRAADGAGSAEGATEALVEIAEAALAFAAQSERRSRWMTGVLRTGIELERGEQQAPDAAPAGIDLVDRVQMAARELHSVALERGAPINVTASREKISATVDRRLVDRLLNRLLLDALLTASNTGVDVEVSIHAGRPQIIVRWEVSLPEWASLPASARALSRQIIARLATQVGGAFTHGEEGGRDVMTLSLSTST